MADFHDRETAFEPEPTGKQKPQPAAPGMKTSPTPALAPGMVVGGRYVIEAELGRGGIGIVFRTQDTQLDNR